MHMLTEVGKHRVSGSSTFAGAGLCKRNQTECEHSHTWSLSALDCACDVTGCLKFQPV